MPDKEELLLFLDFGSAAAIKAASKAMEQPVKLGKTPLHSGIFSIIFCHLGVNISIFARTNMREEFLKFSHLGKSSL